MDDILKQIVTGKKQRLAQRKQELTEADLQARIETLSPPRGFAKSINRSHKISLIAEIKKASPSRGVIRQDFNPPEIASIYKEAGVQAISVITCQDYFLGDIRYLEEVKKVTDCPILRKDFIIEPYQLYESRAFGSDAVLLITQLLSQETLSEFLDLASNLGLDCLVEVHTEKDLRKAMKVKAQLIGINNRNLSTMEIDIKTTQELYPLISKEKVVVVESGIKSYKDLLFFKVLVVEAVLIGEAFMEASDIKARIREIMGW